MFIDSDNALALLKTTNRFLLPSDWWNQPAAYGCLREVNLDSQIPVVAELRMTGEDAGTLYAPCTLPPGKYGGLAIYDRESEGLELFPWAEEEVSEGQNLVDLLDDEIEEATGENPLLHEGPLPDWYVQAHGRLHEKRVAMNRAAVGAIPELVSELGRIGQSLGDVTDVTFFTLAKHPRSSEIFVS